MDEFNGETSEANCAAQARGRAVQAGSGLVRSTRLDSSESRVNLDLDLETSCAHRSQLAAHDALLFAYAATIRYSCERRDSRIDRPQVGLARTAIIVAIRVV